MLFMLSTLTKNSLDVKKLTYEICPEGGAFYGPKIDIAIRDALGRSWQCSTIQCDFALPEKFNLEYVASDGKKARPIVLHRAILGSVERFMGCLLEQFSGALPLCLSPIQAVVIPISKAHEDYCLQLKNKLKSQGIRVEMYDSTDTLNRRIRKAQEHKVPVMLIVGDREVEAGAINVRRFGSKDQQFLAVDDFLSICLKEIKTR